MSVDNCAEANKLLYKISKSYMSSEELSNFVYALEHSLLLRKEARACTENHLMVKMANKYGFKINEKDLDENSIEQKVNKWFDKSKINQIYR